MNGKVTYHQQVSFCGKPRCRKCREGIGHGPYWYAYHTIGGRTTRTYVGKHLPPDAETAMEPPPVKILESADMDDMAGAAAVPGVPGLPVVAPVSLPDNALLRVSTLGQFRLERRVDTRWQTVTDAAWQQSETRTLLGYLLSCPERAATGTQLGLILWPRLDEASARIHLKRVVHDLRMVLGVMGDESEDGADDLTASTPKISSQSSTARRRPARRGTSNVRYFLHSEDDRLMLADQSLLWVDADAFEQVVTQLRTPFGRTGEDERPGQSRSALYEEAVVLYGGEYLPEERGAFWALARRQTLRRNWIGLLLDLADLRLQRGATSGAIDILDRLLAADPANEAAVQRLIVVLARLKRRGESLRAYHRLSEVLRREYQAEPSEETRALFEAARRGEDIPLAADWLRERASAEQARGGEFAEGTRDRPTEHEADKHEENTDDRSLSIVELSSAFSSGPPTPPGQTTQIGRSHQSPLVGREHELEVLRNVLLEVEQGARTQMVAQRRSIGIPLHTQRRPQTVFLMGEAGIGKTRLAEEMSREAQHRGWTVMWSRVYAQESGIPYRLWTETLRKAMSQSSWHWQEVGKHPTIYQPLTALLPELSSVLPRKASLVGPEQEQLRLWEATRTLFSTLSESTPLLIVLDDIQWADKSSCDLLAHLGRNVQGYPILLLCTCRENEIADHPLYNIIAHMQREHTVMTLSVDPLTTEQIARLVSHLPEPMVQHIKDQAAGNPFFAEELARTSPPTLPRTIAAALDSRMSRLSAPCQQLLGNAAVLGGAFDLPIIYAMETRETGGLLADEDTVLDLLDEAQKAGVLAEEGTGTRITYHFWHPLLVSHLYERVSAARRLRLHQRAAALLQRIYQKREEEVAATITHHLVRGGAAPLAIAHYAELAGDRAYALSAYPEAERHYRLAINQLEAVENESALSASDREEVSGQQTHLSYLLERLAECTVILGNFASARGFYERLLEMHRQQPVAANEFERQEEAQVQALLWCEIGRTWRFSQLEYTRACLERGEEALRAVGIVGGPAWARLRYQQSALYLQEGRYNEGHHAAQEALTLFEQQQRKVAASGSESTSGTKMTLIRRILEGDPSDLGRTHNLLGRLANAVGWRTQALSHFSIALALYEQYDYKREISIVLCNMGYIHLKRGEYELAQAMLRRALSLALRIGDDPQASVIYSDLGELADASNDLEEAESQYRRALELAERFDDREYRSRWNAALAEVLCQRGKYTEAIACIIRALSIGRAMRSSPCTGIALVALGKLRIAQACEMDQLPSIHTRLLAHAHDDLRRALALPGLEAETRTRGQLVLAQLLLLLGDVEQARATLLNVIEESHRHELALVEENAKRLLERM